MSKKLSLSLIRHFCHVAEIPGVSKRKEYPLCLRIERENRDSLCSTAAETTTTQTHLESKPRGNECYIRPTTKTYQTTPHPRPRPPRIQKGPHAILWISATQQSPFIYRLERRRTGTGPRPSFQATPLGHHARFLLPRPSPPVIIRISLAVTTSRDNAVGSSTIPLAFLPSRR